MKLFDPKFVHFMWNDALEGKKVLVSDSIDFLIRAVNEGIVNTAVINRSAGGGYSLHSNETGNDYSYAYYDPNYEVKRAFNEGKKIQFLLNNEWRDVANGVDINWLIKEGQSLRVKPEEEKWIVYVQRNRSKSKCRLVCCAEARWGYVQDRFSAKTKLFVGTYIEASEWRKTHEKFTEEIKAWEDGKKIQVYGVASGWFYVSYPSWDTRLAYRVEPECPCVKDIASKACVDCEHSEDDKKHFRPYESSAEMLIDFIARFKVKCPSCCVPLIWLKSKDGLERALVTNYYGETKVLLSDAYQTMEELLEQYTYLDGSPVGMEVKE